jgi:hypothetical protein
LCDFREQSVNVNELFFAHDCVLVEWTAWAFTVVHSNRASFLIHQCFVVELGMGWETIVWDGWVGTQLLLELRKDGVVSHDNYTPE